MNEYLAVIGGAGFLAERLSRRLDDRLISYVRYDVNVDNNSDEIIDLDVVSQGSLNQLDGASAIINLAAVHRDDIKPISRYDDINVQGSVNVCRAARKFAINKIIFTSSVAIYGLDKNNPDENHKHDPFNHYGKSKWQAEIVIREWYNKDPDNKSITIIRPTVIFGERNRGNVYNLLKQISSGHFLMIGKGDNKKSMAYVENVVGFIIHRLEKTEPGYHVFNYADKPDFTMKELVSVIENKMNIVLPKIQIPRWLGMFFGYMFDLFSLISTKKTSISSVRVKKFCAVTQFDASKVHYSFNAPYTLKEGLDKTLEHEFINPKKDEILFFSE